VAEGRLSDWISLGVLAFWVPRGAGCWDTAQGAVPPVTEDTLGVPGGVAVDEHGRRTTTCWRQLSRAIVPG